MKKGLLVIVYCLFSAMAIHAQNIVSWKFSAKKTGKKEAVLIFTATIDPTWHLYSMNQGQDGPVPTTFRLEPSDGYELIGSVEEPTPHKELNSLFMMEVGYFEKSATFTQKIKLKGKKATVNGKVTFMACNESQCIPPITTPFKIDVK